MSTITIQNPFWDEVQEYLSLYHTHPDFYETRSHFCRQYSWALADPETLDLVASWLGPKAVEMGAGRGYWAWQLAAWDVDILAFDLAPVHITGRNEYHSPYDEKTGEPLDQLLESFYPVEPGIPAMLGDYPDRSLFLCWPPYRDDMALECLESYTGRYLVYIGEDKGGCTGNDAFFRRLEQQWKRRASHTLAQWDSYSDRVILYERRSKK